MTSKEAQLTPISPEPDIRAYHIRDIKKYKQWLKIFLLVLLALFLTAAVSFGSRLYQEKTAPPPPPTTIPTPKPTIPADWQTYKNKKYGFEIEYPPYLVAKENKTLGETTAVNFVSRDNPDDLYFFIEKNFAGDWRAKKHQEEKIIIDGVEGKISLWLIGDDRATLYASFEKDDDYWHVFYKVWEKGEKDENEEFQRLKQILSTFKFLEEESCSKEGTNFSLDYEEAIEIAKNSGCLQYGRLKETHFCNFSTGTWLIDLDIDKPGCYPACVIDVVTRQARTNWRCTGAISP